MSSLNVLAIGNAQVAFAGKTGVYFKSLHETSCSFGDGGKKAEPHPALRFSTDWVEKKAHIECIAISKDETLIAVGDSMRGLHLFQIKSNGGAAEWVPRYTCNTNKRIIKVQFTSDQEFVTILDKQGDIFAVRISSDCQQFSGIKKILGHTSFISDYIISVKSGQIVSCDRDEKIRISNFPDAYLIQGFMLGHTESVMSLASLQFSAGEKAEALNYILSISVSGALILWNLTNPVNGAITNYIKMWNIRELLSDDVKEAEVRVMKACNTRNEIYVSVAFGGSTRIIIFKISVPTFCIELLHELQTTTELPIMDWAGTPKFPTLLVYEPLSSSVRWWQGNSKIDQLTTEGFGQLLEEICSDIKALAETYKPSAVPMKKRQTNFEDSLHVYKDDLEAKKLKQATDQLETFLESSRDNDH